MIKKLEMLYQRSLYSVALNIAKTQKLDGDSVADIHRQFGDSMYSKADYNGAMEHYVQTIGHVQPSYVIRKVCVLAEFIYGSPIESNVAFIVPRCATNTSAGNLPARAPLSGSRKLGSYNLASQCLYQAQGRLTTGFFHQDCVAATTRPRPPTRRGEGY